MHLPLIGLKFGAGVDTMIDSMQSIQPGIPPSTLIDG
jgi:hypothetical protein